MPLVDMELDDEAKNDLSVPVAGMVAGMQEKLVPAYPWGLRLSLTEQELCKLGLDCSEIKAGDYIHLRAFARVKDVTTGSREHPVTGDSENTARVELQIEQLAAEDEDKEGERDKPKRRLREDFYT